jgi:deoxyribonuclease-4
MWQVNIGAHVSIAGGIDKSIERIVQMGGNVLMTFASSPRSLKTANIKPKTIEGYKTKKKEAGIKAHFFHAPYLINLAADSKTNLRVGLDCLISYQQLASAMGVDGSILHVGSHKGVGLPAKIDQVVRALNEALDSTPKGTKLFLENSAGQAGSIGADFEEISKIIDRLGDRSKVGVCLDTQHAFAAGYTLETIIEKFNKIIGIKYLNIVHFNDSKSEFGSHLDRHENLGKGTIGKESLKNFINDSRLASIPFILEVPGDGNGPRKKDVDYVKDLI